MNKKEILFMLLEELNEDSEHHKDLYFLVKKENLEDALNDDYWRDMLNGW